MEKTEYIREDGMHCTKFTYTKEEIEQMKKKHEDMIKRLAERGLIVSKDDEEKDVKND